MFLVNDFKEIHKIAMVSKNDISIWIQKNYFGRNQKIKKNDTGLFQKTVHFSSITMSALSKSFLILWLLNNAMDILLSYGK